MASAVLTPDPLRVINVHWSSSSVVLTMGTELLVLIAEIPTSSVPL